MANTAQRGGSRSAGAEARSGTRASAASAPRKRPVTRRAAARQETSRDPRHDFSDEEWHDMVSTAAYFQAEARGFEGGSADEDWYQAEALLREQLAQAEDEADDKTGP
jgi:hypothetical protein